MEDEEPKKNGNQRFTLSDWIEGALLIFIAIAFVGWCVQKFAS
ncbi:hypothetical protein ABZW18_00110 [Streptomyces sp. NPDC004647]